VLIALIKSLAPGSIIYVVALDRLTRLGIEEIFMIRRHCMNAKVDIITEIGSLVDANDMALAGMAYAAMLERKAISARMERFHAKRAEAGIKRKRAKVWEKATPRLLEMKASGMTIRQIAEEASKEFGTKFLPYTVQQIFKRQRDEQHTEVLLSDRDSQLDEMGRDA
jgi:DNA invertase Pin-like site-specific DNA recombinase